MKKIVLVLLPLIAVACFLGSRFSNPDAKVVVVDGRIITFARFDSTATLIAENSDADVSSDTIKQNALDSLIAEELVAMRVDSVVAALDSDWQFRQ